MWDFLVPSIKILWEQSGKWWKGKNDMQISDVVEWNEEGLVQSVVIGLKLFSIPVWC